MSLSRCFFACLSSWYSSVVCCWVVSRGSCEVLWCCRVVVGRTAVIAVVFVVLSFPGFGHLHSSGPV